MDWHSGHIYSSRLQVVSQYAFAHIAIVQMFL